jgi:hypothetical protein
VWCQCLILGESAISVESSHLRWNSVPGEAGIRCAVLVTVPFYAIGSGFEFQIDVGIGYFIASCPIANHKKNCILVCLIQEMVPIASSGR